jgi:hypothetical protein
MNLNKRGPCSPRGGRDRALRRSASVPNGRFTSARRRFSFHVNAIMFVPLRGSWPRLCQTHCAVRSAHKMSSEDGQETTAGAHIIDYGKGAPKFNKILTIPRQGDCPVSLRSERISCNQRRKFGRGAEPLAHQQPFPTSSGSPPHPPAPRLRGQSGALY